MTRINAPDSSMYWEEESPGYREELEKELKFNLKNANLDNFLDEVQKIGFNVGETGVIFKRRYRHSVGEVLEGHILINYKIEKNERYYRTNKIDDNEYILNVEQIAYALEFKRIIQKRQGIFKENIPEQIVKNRLENLLFKYQAYVNQINCVLSLWGKNV